jgi:hypothetical protein
VPAVMKVIVAWGSWSGGGRGRFVLWVGKVGVGGRGRRDGFVHMSGRAGDWHVAGDGTAVSGADVALAAWGEKTHDWIWDPRPALIGWRCRRSLQAAGCDGLNPRIRQIRAPNPDELVNLVSI